MEVEGLVHIHCKTGVTCCRNEGQKEQGQAMGKEGNLLGTDWWGDGYDPKIYVPVSFTKFPELI